MSGNTALIGNLKTFKKTKQALLKVLDKKDLDIAFRGAAFELDLLSEKMIGKEKKDVEALRFQLMRLLEDFLCFKNRYQYWLLKEERGVEMSVVDVNQVWVSTNALVHLKKCPLKSVVSIVKTIADDLIKKKSKNLDVLSSLHQIHDQMLNFLNAQDVSKETSIDELVDTYLRMQKLKVLCV